MSPRATRPSSSVRRGRDPNQHAWGAVRVAGQFLSPAEQRRWATMALRKPTKTGVWSLPGIRDGVIRLMGATRAYHLAVPVRTMPQASGRSPRVYANARGLTRTQPVSRIDSSVSGEQGGNFTSTGPRARHRAADRDWRQNIWRTPTSLPDVARAQIFLADLKRFDAEGKLPNP